MLKKLTPFVVLLAAVIPAYAAVPPLNTASLLVSQCKQSVRQFAGDNVSDMVGAGVCVGTFNGIMMLHTYNKFNGKSSSICWPGSVDIKQMIGVYVKYMDDHPERLDEHMIITVVDAAHDAFKCNAK